jgi:hypothetical protein
MRFVGDVLTDGVNATVEGKELPDTAEEIAYRFKFLRAVINDRLQGLDKIECLRMLGWLELDLATNGVDTTVAPVAWMHEFTDPFTGERRQEARRKKPSDFELQPGDTLRPMVYAAGVDSVDGGQHE